MNKPYKKSHILHSHRMDLEKPLLDGILYNLNLKADQHGLAIMLKDQLLGRWLTFCEKLLQQDSAISWPHVQQFMNSNLEWAKVQVMVKINRSMWPDID